MRFVKIRNKLLEPEVMMRFFGAYLFIYGIFFALRITNIYSPASDYIQLIKALIAPVLFLYSAISIFYDRKSGWIMLVFLQFFMIGLAILQIFDITEVPPAFAKLGGRGFFFVLWNLIIPIVIILGANRKSVLARYNISLIFRISIIFISILVVAYMTGYIKF